VYNRRVANQRAPGQICIAFTLDKRLLDVMDDARSSPGARCSRSEFIRVSIFNYLRSRNIHVPEYLIDAPDRASPLKTQISERLERLGHALPAGIPGEMTNDRGNLKMPEQNLAVNYRRKAKR
jgi:Arc/MetJ-type ribon-helix-helix transcriptional regulator